ncbi:hypothetical protein GCK32_000241 [Trichostrongylus colubriformis]|uniref:DUF7083 domain-containing protein n=1 Tax=Trichostrongylus colubriformis TaxID=6319 RepID=A0AAN8F8W9_TRICO
MMQNLQSQQLEMMQNLLTRMAENKGVTTPSTLPSGPSDPYGNLIRDIPNFVYDVEDDETFGTWFKRYGPVIDDRGCALSDDRKRNLIIDKLDKSTYRRIPSTSYPLNQGYWLFYDDQKSDETVWTQKNPHSSTLRIFANQVFSVDQFICIIPRFWEHDKEEVRKP